MSEDLPGAAGSELLVDLARLLKKHGRSAFDDLIEALNDPAFAPTLARALESVSDAPPSSPVAKRSRRTAAEILERARIEVSEQHGDAARSLVRMMGEVADGTTELSLRDLEEVADRFGVHLARSTRSRAEAISRIGLQFGSLTAGEQESLVAELSAAAHGSAGALQDWNRIIQRSREDASE